MFDKKLNRILFYFGAGFALLMLGYYLRDINWKAVYNNMFVTIDKKFNWTGMASVLAILGLIFNFWDSRRKVRADLVSKSRITWMLEVRRQYAEYLTLAHTIAQDLKNLNRFVSHGISGKDYTSIKNKMYKRQFELKNKYNFLVLYITEESNEKLYGPIIDIHYKLAMDIHEFTKKNNPNAPEISDVRYSGNYPNKPNDIDLFALLNIAIENASDFFKEEWERAKKGK
ncbi:hypothetical protein [Leuconostoc mesenteroides]|uniref:hypothetical protein n=1 Tax=Leuconostoc mesenteroides TaxID=1245 RepID=UPI0011451295|nr:hypothetical protein [Leuconostoc mesenteroides]GEA91379.1 hypothetical protein LME01_11150 [Leuconostoc mesenteroides subsp. mesenteroides]